MTTKIKNFLFLKLCLGRRIKKSPKELEYDDKEL